MSKYSTNCRDNRIKKFVLIGEKYTDLLADRLNSIGITVISVPNNPYVDSRLSGHADLSVFDSGAGELFISKHIEHTELYRELIQLGFKLITVEGMSEKYPKDALLNLCRCGNRIICNPKTASRQIVSFFTNKRPTEIIPVKQGYTGCSICVIDDNATITADRGIYAELINHGFDVLLINEGYITLEGFDYGFIGGATFRLGDSKLAFTGLLDGHPDKDKILEFLGKHNAEPVFLTERQLFDIGGGFMITKDGQL